MPPEPQRRTPDVIDYRGNALDLSLDAGGLVGKAIVLHTLNPSMDGVVTLAPLEATEVVASLVAAIALGGLQMAPEGPYTCVACPADGWGCCGTWNDGIDRRPIVAARHRPRVTEGDVAPVTGEYGSPDFPGRDTSESAGSPTGGQIAGPLP